MFVSAITGQADAMTAAVAQRYVCIALLHQLVKQEVRALMQAKSINLSVFTQHMMKLTQSFSEATQKLQVKG